MKKHFLTIAFLAISTILFAQNKQSKFDVQGHRGARGIMPENTIEAMIKGLELGVTTLEMDIVISKDKKAVVSQEPYFNHEFSLTPAGKEILFKDEKKNNIFQRNLEITLRSRVHITRQNLLRHIFKLKLKKTCGPRAKQRIISIIFCRHCSLVI